MRDTTNVTVRTMHGSDVPHALQVWHQSWVDTYVRPDLGVTQEWVDAQWARRLEPENVRAFTDRVAQSATQPSPQGCFLVAERDGAVIGVAAPFTDSDGRRRVGALYVAREHLGTGAGAELMTAVLDHFGNSDPVYVQVAGYNHRATDFYQRFGFVKLEGSEEFEVGTVPDFWMQKPATP